MTKLKHIPKKELADILEKKHKDIENVLNTISHDLRGPVSTILGLNNLISQDSSKEELKQYLDVIHKLALDLDKKMSNTVELLSIANVESRKTELIPSKLFESVFMELAEGNDNYNFSFEHTGTPTIYIEKVVFYNAFKNLLDCVFSFTLNNNKKVGLRSMANENMLKMTMVSNFKLSRGMYDDLKNILNGTTRVYSNMGMKLHLAKIYLKRLDGEIAFTPGKDKTTIRVMVPLRNQTGLEI